MIKNVDIIIFTDFNNGISKNGKIPWNIEEFFKIFEKVTSSQDKINKNAIIFSKNSHVDISELSKELMFKIRSEDNIVNKLFEISNNREIDRLFVIGGESLLKKILNNYLFLIDKIYLFKIIKNYKCDRFLSFKQDDFIMLNYEQQSKILSYIYQRINKDERQYLNLLSKIMMKGELQSNTISLFGEQLVFDLEYYIPIITTKKLSFTKLLQELITFINNHIKGKILDKSNNNNNVKLQSDYFPYLTLNWNLNELNKITHTFFQFNIRHGKYLDCQLYQGDVDMTIGAPFNIAIYSLFIYMICYIIKLIPGKLIYIFGNVSINIDYFNEIIEQIKKEPFNFPKLKIIGDVENINDFKKENFELIDYKFHN